MDPLAQAIQAGDTNQALALYHQHKSEWRALLAFSLEETGRAQCEQARARGLVRNGDALNEAIERAR